MTPTEKRRILLVEDDASMRKLIEVTLSRAGYEVMPCEDGLTAMQFFLSAPVDAVVADAIMPNLSGYELCRLIRARGTGTPCVILSGLDKEHEESGLFDAFVTKDPNLAVRLLATLDRLI